MKESAPGEVLSISIPVLLAEQGIAPWHLRAHRDYCKIAEAALATLDLVKVRGGPHGHYKTRSPAFDASTARATRHHTGLEQIGHTQGRLAADKRVRSGDSIR